MSADSLTDFAIMSLVLVGSHLLRYRVKLLQYTYMPVSLIAGLICLFCGWQFLDIIPFSVNANFTHNIESYPKFLVVLLFATLFLGKREGKTSIKQTIEHAGDTFFFNIAALTSQYGLSLLFGFLVMSTLFPSLPDGFSLMLPAGFAGGHGTAAAIGGTLEKYGWAEATTIGYTIATIGLIVGVVLGMILINIATRKGWTRLVKSMQEMPLSMRTGFVPKSERECLGRETVSPIAIDSLTWHFAIVASVAASAFLVSHLFDRFVPGPALIPVFSFALLLGALLQKIFNVFGIGEYIDKKTIHRIGALVTDYLVAFGVASITLTVVVQYALPIAILIIFGTTFTLALFWFIGRKIFKNFWFERSMVMFGWMTGTVATSVLLVRIIDPDLRSTVLEDFGLAYIGIAFVEILIIALVPMMVGRGIVWAPALILVSMSVTSIFLSKWLVGWHNGDPKAIRNGETGV